jgi:regulator of replication initiation timing
MKNSYELKLTTILEMEVSQLRERLYKVKTENIQLMMEIENLKKKLNEKKP